MTRAPLVLSVAPISLSPGPCSPGSARRSAWTHPPRFRPRQRRHRRAPSRPDARAGGRPGCTWVSGMSSSVPSARMRRAVFGASPSSALMAAPVSERAFSSSTWPSSVSEMITAAASKYTATWPSMRKEAGKMPGSNGDHAVEIGRARAQSDQGPHVRAAVLHRLRAAHEERPARPQHDGRTQGQLDPGAGGTEQADRRGRRTWRSG
jgi:hypothetical protein